jgi:hypothetical protein
MYVIEVYSDHRNKDPCMLELHSGGDAWSALTYGTACPLEVLLEISDGRLSGFQRHSVEENNPNALNRFEPRTASIWPVTTSVYLSYLTLLGNNVSYKYIKVLIPKTEEKFG